MLVQPPETPWENLYTRQADQAFAEATSMTRSQLRALRPPLPQIIANPPRFGYPSYVERQPTIEQVFGIHRLPPSWAVGLSQGPSHDDQTNDTGKGHFQGSQRNVLSDAFGW